MDGLAAYLNGEWVNSSALRIPIDDLGFLVGATVTERLRTFGGKVFRFDDHLSRLRRSLEIVGLESERIADQVAVAVPEFLRRNHARIAADDDWSIVAFATPGAAGSNQPTVCVHGHPLPFRAWASQFETGLPAVISRIRQVPPDCWPAELKCRSRMHYYLADRDAAARRPGARAILLDQDGYVAESTTANVIAYRAGEGFISPPPEHILFGVSLGVVRELATKMGVPFVMRPLSVDEFCSADEVLLTSTSICVLPIIECDGKAIGSGQPHPMYRRLLAAWSELVGLPIDEQARRFADRK